MLSMAFVTSPKDFLERIVTRLQVKAFFVVVCALIFFFSFCFSVERDEYSIPPFLL
jgi:uncharacterized membrane protein